MTIRLLLSASAIALSLIALQSSAKAAIKFPESCRMGSCHTTTLDSKEALRSNEYGTLYVVNETTNQYPDDSFSERAAQDYQMFVNYHGSDYITEQSQKYVFCSTQIPTVLSEYEGRYIANRLAVFTTPSGFSWSSHIMYLATCHNLAGPDYFAPSVQTLLIREGYTTQYIERDDQFDVPNILEVMELYPEKY